jgi:hypothetical protein
MEDSVRFLFLRKCRQHKRKNDERGRWKQENLKWAINAFKEKAVGNNAASKDFGIPSMTLRRRILQDNNKKPLGPGACLSTDAEMKMMSRIQQMQAAGFALSRKDVKILAFKLTQKLGIGH